MTLVFNVVGARVKVPAHKSCFVFPMEIKPRASHILGKHFPIELYPRPAPCFELLLLAPRKEACVLLGLLRWVKKGERMNGD